MNHLKITSMLLSAMFLCTSCVKEGPIGPQGPEGPQGPQGSQGPPGSGASVDHYSFTRNLSSFSYHSSSNIWRAQAPSSLPDIDTDEAALVFVWIDPADGNFDWVPLPFTHYFNAGNTTNHFAFGIDIGNIYLTIRNSTGGQPYSTMSGNLQYKVFILKTAVQQQMLNESVDLSDFEAVRTYLADKQHWDRSAPTDLDLM